MLGAHLSQEGEPSLFFAVVDATGTLSAEGWFLTPKLEDYFELELYECEGGLRLDTLIVYLAPQERLKKTWQDTLTLEVKRRALRPNED